MNLSHWLKSYACGSQHSAFEKMSFFLVTCAVVLCFVLIYNVPAHELEISADFSFDKEITASIFTNLFLIL